MLKSLGLVVVITTVLAGCVGVSTTTPPPSAGFSFGITTPAPVTPAPTVGATAAATPTISPTAAVTASPTVEPTETPGVEPTETPAPVANDILFGDTMDDPASGWGLADDELVTIAYQGGALRLVVHNAGGAGYTPRALGQSFGVVIAATQFELADTGGVGALCGDDTGAFYGAVLTTVGELVFFSVEDGTVNVLDRVDDTGVEIPLDEAGVFAIECHGMATGALRLVALMDDTGPLGVYQTDEGPDTFRSVALWGEGDNDEFTVDFTQAAAYGIPGSADDEMTPEGVELLTHVPDLFRETCIEAPVVGGNADAIMHCFLQTEGTGVELLSLASFADNATMDIAYQEAVDEFGVESIASCQEGPNETTWSLDAGPLGRLQCAPQTRGIRFDWTDDRLAILSTLIDFDGDYQNTYDTWLEAGPDL